MYSLNYTVWEYHYVVFGTILASCKDFNYSLVFHHTDTDSIILHACQRPKTAAVSRPHYKIKYFSILYNFKMSTYSSVMYSCIHQTSDSIPYRSRNVSLKYPAQFSLNSSLNGSIIPLNRMLDRCIELHNNTDVPLQGYLSSAWSCLLYSMSNAWSCLLYSVSNAWSCLLYSISNADHVYCIL